MAIASLQTSPMHWITSPVKPSQKTGYRDYTWVSAAMSASKLGSILRYADMGNLGYACRLYDEILTKEPALNGLVNDRILRTASKTVFVLPSSRLPIDLEIAQYCADVLSNIKEYRPQGRGFQLHGDLSSISSKLLLAFWHAFSVGWIYWESWQGYPMPVAIEFFDQEDFNVDPSDQSLLVNSSGSFGFSGQPLHHYDQRCVLECRYERTSQKLARAALARTCSYPWFMGWMSWQFSLRYLEKLSVGSLVVEENIDSASSLQSADIEEAREFVRNFVTGTDFVLPHGWQSRFQQASAGSHKAFVDFDKMKKEDFKFLIQGQTASGTGGSSTTQGAEVGEQIREQGVDAGDAKFLSRCLKDLLRKAIDARYGTEYDVPDIAIGSVKLNKLVEIVTSETAQEETSNG